MSRCSFILITAVACALVPEPALAQQRPSTDAIEAAAERGAVYLRRTQNRDGTWTYWANDLENNLGLTALCGLALIESLPEDTRPEDWRKDVHIKAAADVIRNNAAKIRRTYGISLAIIFLDRYADGKDPEMIRSLATRLVMGQELASGGWSYMCDANGNPAQWQKFLADNRQKTDFGKFNAANQKADNSNTQFAILAMWIARRHKIFAEYPLALAEWRFRNTQQEDGGWDYGVTHGGATPSMTCAGMLGLALGFGTAKERQAQLRAGNLGGNPGGGGGAAAAPLGDIRQDRQVLAGKAYLAKAMDRRIEEIPHFLYFVWSLERVSVAYGFEEYAGKDWYAWGANHLFALQKPDGSWQKDEVAPVDTCFGLLFLKRANLVKDLNISGKAVIRGGAQAGLNKGGPPPKPAEKTNIPEVAAAAAPAEAAKLAKELVVAQPKRAQEILDRLENTKDGTGSFTDALVESIPKLKGEIQDKAREALAGRYVRQPIDAIRARLKDPNPEVRISGVIAAGWKENDTIVPDLIPLVENSNETLAMTAQQSLEALTKKNFGGDAARWREFWQQRKK